MPQALQNYSGIAKVGSFQSIGRGSLHVNRPLTNISVAFMQQSEFVADKVFPVVPVSARSDVYFIYSAADFNRGQMAPRAPGTESKGISFSFTTDSYLADVYAAHINLDEQTVANMDAPLSAQRDATMFLTFQSQLYKELLWRDQFFTPGIPGATWTFVADGVVDESGTAAGSYDPTDVTDTNNKLVHWSEYAGVQGSDPISDVRVAKRFMQVRTGYRPNVMVMGREVFDKLIDHPDIVGRLDRGQTTGPARATRESLAALFELDEIHVMDAIQNTAAPGLSATNAFIGGKHALLLYRPQTAGIMLPSAGYTFAWTGLPGISGTGIRMKTFYIEQIESERVEIQMAFVHKKVSEDLGFFFNGIVA